MNIQNANDARYENHLKGSIRANGLVLTNKEFIEKLLADGYLPVSHAVPKVEYPSGKRVNSWTNEQMREHTSRRASSGTKIEYRMKKDDTFYGIAKFSYEYAVSLCAEENGEPSEQAFIIFNMPGMNVPGSTRSAARPFVTVAGLSVLESEERTKSFLSTFFEGARLAWSGKARTQEEAFSRASL